MPIRLDAADVSDVSVALQRTVDVVGRVTLEDSTAPFVRAPGYGPISVMSASWVTRGLIRDFHRWMTTDPSRQKGVFGPRTLDVVNLPRGWYVRSIHYAGRDIIDEPTTFKDSGGESAIEIVLSNRGAVVVGRATDESGNAVGRAVILMFPADAARISWRLPAETRTSPAGQFRAGPVRRGDYCIVALPASARRPIQPGESARLARLAAAAERITLSELEERTMDLRVVAER